MSRLRKIDTAAAEAKAPTPRSHTPKPHKNHRAFRGFDVAQYWDKRYQAGRHSGDGSRGEHAKRKAGIIRRFMQVHNLKNVYDLGCGDMFIMNQVHKNIPDIQYTGVDISPEIVSRNKKLHPWGKFQVVEAGAPIEGSYDLVICYDVLFHLPNPAFDRTLKILRDADARWVILSAWRKPMPNMAQHVFFNEFDPAVIGTVVSRDDLDAYRTSFTLEKKITDDDHNNPTDERGHGELPAGTSRQGTTNIEDLLFEERESSSLGIDETGG